MKCLAEHKFENDKSIAVMFLDQPKEGVPEVDTLALVFRDGDKHTGHHMRPDEALIVIRLLSEGLYESVKGYEIG
jgi:hypothetical protein